MAKLFYFNPTCELEVANKLPHYHPPIQVKNMVEDAETLPVFFADLPDKVWTQKLPSKQYLNFMAAFGIAEDRFLCFSEGEAARVCALNGLTDGIPWGWSPTATEKFVALKSAAFGFLQWQGHFETWYRRETALELLVSMVSGLPVLQFMERQLPVVCKTLVEVENYMYEWKKMVLKAPLSSSGRGVQFYRKPELYDSNKQWIQGVLQQQGAVMIEPLLDRVFDFSLHFFKNNDGKVCFKGSSALSTNSNGKYLGNSIGNISLIPDVPKQFDFSVLSDVQLHIANFLEQSEVYADYVGPLGIDMFLYDRDDALYLHPCVEINARHSMGYLALSLERYLVPGKTGLMRAELLKNVDESRFYVQKKGDFILQCYLPLSDFWNAQQFVFTLTVE